MLGSKKQNSLCLIMIFFAWPALADWTVQSVSSSSGGQDCYLATEQQTIFDGYHDSAVHIKVTEAEILFIADSPIDTEYKDIGMAVDDNAFIAMDNLVDRYSARFASSYSDIVAQFIKGKQVKIQTRFWPEWPTTGPHAASFSLSGFTKAYNSLKNCNQ